jgi:hypothetical protein
VSRNERKSKNWKKRRKRGKRRLLLGITGSNIIDARAPWAKSPGQ